MKLKSLKIFLMAATLSSAVAFADAKPAGNTFWDVFTFTYSADYHGPSLADPFQVRQPDAGTGEYANGAPVEWRNYLSPGFKLTPTISLGFVFYTAFTHPAGQDATPDTVKGGSRLVKVRDPYVKLNNSKFYENGNYKLATSTRAYFPTSNRSATKPQKAITFEQRFYNDYEVPNSKVTVSALAIVDLNIYHNTMPATQSETGMDPSQPELFVYLGPSVSYQMLPTLGVSLTYEMGAQTERQDSMLNFYNGGAGATDLEPSVSWDVTPTFNLSPYLDIKTGQRIALDTTTYNLLLTWKLK